MNFKFVYAPTLLVSVLILLVAVFTRFHNLDAQSLWNDEGNSLRLAQRDVGDLIDAAGRDIHPPGYYLALKAWISLAGESEFGLRSLSALEGVLAVAFTMALGRVLFSRGTGQWAGILVALSPFAVYYSQETRMYAQLGMLSVVSMWALARWLTSTSAPVPLATHGEGGKSSWRWPLALALINAAGLYTQYSYPFTMLVQGIVFVGWVVDGTWPNPAARREFLQRMVMRYIVANLLTLALFLPWLPTAWDQIRSWPRTGIEIAVIDQLRTVFMWITVGNTFGEPNDLVVIWPVILMLGAVLVYRTDWRPSYLWRVMVPVLWGGIVVGALLLSGAYRTANLKFLLPAQIAISLLLAQGAIRLRELLLTEFNAETESLPKRALDRMLDRVLAHMLVSVGMLILAGVIAGQVVALNRLYTDQAYARDNYRAIAAYIEANAAADDAVILNAPNQIEVFSYYYDGAAPIYQLPRGLGGDDAQTQADVLAILDDHRRIFVVFWGEEERDPNNSVQNTLNTAAYPVASRWYGDVRLAQYAVLEAGTVLPVAPGEEVRFGEHITLTGYAITPETIRTGDVIGVTLFWKTNVRLDRRYKVTVQILRADGTLASQHDSEPGGNRVMTIDWPVNKIVVDPHGVVVPPDLGPGTYTVIVGLYDINSPAERLPVFIDGQMEGGQVMLTEFSLSANE